MAQDDRTEIEKARDELIDAAISWEAGDGTEAEDDRLSDAVFRFRQLRGDFSGEVRPKSQLERVVQSAVERAHAEGRTLDPADLAAAADAHR